MALYVEQLLDGLGLGDHDEAERRVNRLFMPWRRSQQRAAVEALVRLAATTANHDTQLVACALIEAADRLDPDLIAVEDVEHVARSSGASLRSSAAVLLWQWAKVSPARVPVPLLARLTQPSAEDWYVHAAARAGAKHLLLARSSARSIFDRMAASHQVEDRSYALSDLADVASIEPRAVPLDLVGKLARDQDHDLATRAAELLTVLETVSEQDRRSYRGPFGM